MLYIVLLLVLGALGLLVTALTTANTLWAWLSVGISLVAAAILVLDWLGNRRKAAAPAVAPVEAADDIDDAVDDDADDFVDDEPAPEPVIEAPPAAPEVPLGASVEVDPEAEPAEESTDAADLLVISGLTADVRVLDERPRYHLPKCGWLANRPSIPLPISEARQLGFTPCAVCSPDAALAAKHRAGRGARQ
ncbi:hypothetical protein [Actinokineospora sp. HUAS TT18]|uniref:hypothetical protein n=1 Tax=Actinokineospora sp. HUAS TT18 TaxID=3447451 RepID=UPI003F5203A9